MADRCALLCPRGLHRELQMADRAEVDVYATEYARTGFLARCSVYRVRRVLGETDPRSTPRSNIFGPTTTPLSYIGGKRLGLYSNAGCRRQVRNTPSHIWSDFI